MIFEELPMGFSFALAQNTTALEHFTRMSEQEQASVLEQIHSIQSKSEMRDFVSKL